MKVIIEDLNSEKYNLNLSLGQIKFANWLVNNDIIYDVKVIDDMEWEEIE